MITIFHDQTDPEAQDKFERWRQTTAYGYYINYRSPRNIMIHRVGCPHDTPWNQKWGSLTKTKKVCSNSEDELGEWARANAYTPLKRCADCSRFRQSQPLAINSAPADLVVSRDPRHPETAKLTWEHWQTWRTAGEPLPKALALAGPEDIQLPAGRVVSIPRATARFSPWREDITINTWGNKPVLDVQGEQTFAEVALLRMFQASGWEARWLEAYNAPPQWPLVLNRWHPDGIKACEVLPLGEARIERMLRTVITNNNGKCSGCWDIIAWRGSALICAEAKHVGKDRLKDTQKRWIEASLDAGLSVDSFLIVEWRY
jgi:hypothetical protein